MSNKQEFCTANCEFFRCGQHSLFFNGKEAQCRYAEDICDPKNCKFSRCVKGKLLSDGRCSMTIKAKKFEVRTEEIGEPIRLPGKLAQRIREKELF
jgi:hypothetical protein